VPEALDKGVAHYSELLDLAAVTSKEDVQLIYQICLLGRKDLHLAADLKSGFEMVLLRALAFRPDANPPLRQNTETGTPQEGEPPAKKSELAAAVDGPVAAEPAPAASSPAKLTAVQNIDSNAAVDIAPAEALYEEPLAAPNKEPSASLNKEQEPSAAFNEEPPEVAPQQLTIKKISLQDFTPHNWIDIRKQLSIGASLGEIASHCLYQGRQGSQLQFLIDSDETSLYDAAHQQSLAEALSEYFAQPLSVEISFGVAEQETPRAVDIREKSERLAEAVEAINSDPSVIKFKQLFDGTLDEKSVRPID
jgi:DNA polymerase-3 subunit gamma/tau